ncbi:iron-siderophore ABC transporter substrate-binding protein [Nakamurella leprariae]|uniref:Iron-siderophore ABC transporter substrate-binding protein n=1 Tax=Nakamurella leprariae TaxID=2803911 RepID=A0A939C2P6_9ACTN|nr:iron-siderophore ABC transporter substrate-binding protein [Nakamurella leprariae]MBM9468504.1 iron-siderophore ABC transporter substrate-binding protein [Nakamurella leprariae]
MKLPRPRLAMAGIAGVAAAAMLLSACGGSDDAASSSSTSSSAASSSAASSSAASSSAGSSSTGGGAAAAGGLPATVDTMFGQVEIPVPADGELTVVALGWSDAEIALALGVQPVAVYDWQGFGEEHKGVGPWATERFGDVEPTVLANTGDSLDYEAIQVLDPDLILNTRSAGDQAQYDRLSQIAPTVSPPADTAAFGTAWDVQTQLVADALGLSADGETLVGQVEETITEAADANPQFAGKTAVSGTKFGDAYGAYIAGDARWDLLADLGFEQNPPVLALPAQGFYVPVSAEQITAFDADVAVMFPIGYTLAEMEADPLIASLAVVKDGRTVFLAADDQVAQAFSAASPLSIPIAVDGIAPQLAAIVTA